MQRNRLKICVSLALLLGLANTRPIEAAFAQAAAVLPLAPHHALYKLTLLNSKGANALASATGLIDYDFGGTACKGYTTSFRQLTELQPAEGDAHLNDSRSTTFEDGSGSEFTFKTRTSTDRDGENGSEVEGQAQKSGTGVMSVTLQRSPEKTMLGPEILFPTEHLRKIISTAESGGKLLSASVFDGSDSGKKVYRTLSVIGPAVGPAADDPSGRTEAMKAMRRWPVTISYFEGETAEQPAYVLSFDLYENGVSRALKLDYGDFVLSGALTELTLAGSGECAQP